MAYAQQAQSRYTPQAYLQMERCATTRSEYVNGEIFAMSGASRGHNRLTVSIVSELDLQMKGRTCNVYVNDLWVKVNETGMYTYPDVVVVCGEEQFEDEELDTLLNPTVIIEVLSPSTEAYDRGGKFAHYRQVASLSEYLLVSQETLHVEHYIRQPDGQWLLSYASGGEAVVDLPTIGCRLSLAEVYKKTGLLG